MRRMTLLHIFLHTPAWVWALLTALLVLGAWQSLPRRVLPQRLFVLPAVLLAVSLVSGSLPLTWANGAAWLAAAAAAALAARRVPPSARVRFDGRRLHLPARATPLLAVVGGFALRYATAVGLVLHPQWRQEVTLLAGLAVLDGTVTGLLAGRAWALASLARGGTHATGGTA